MNGIACYIPSATTKKIITKIRPNYVRRGVQDCCDHCRHCTRGKWGDKPIQANCIDPTYLFCKLDNDIPDPNSDYDIIQEWNAGHIVDPYGICDSFRTNSIPLYGDPQK